MSSVDDESPAQEADIRVGDIILQANMQPVASIDALQKVVTGQGIPRGVLALKIRRGGNAFFRTLQLKK